ncbi:hypothetical protein D3C72_2559990 [compost metagenome]
MMRSEAMVSGSARRRATSAMERAALRRSWARAIMMAKAKNSMMGTIVPTPMATRPGMATRSATDAF